MRCPKCGGYSFDKDDKCLFCGYIIPKPEPPSWWGTKDWQVPATPRSGEEAGETPHLETCPACSEKSLYWNKKDNRYECLNIDCGKTFRKDEVERKVDYTTRVPFGGGSEPRDRGITTADAESKGLIKWDAESGQFIPARQKAVPPLRKPTKEAKPSIKKSPKIKRTLCNILLAFLKSRWFLIVVGLAIAYVSIGYYPLLLSKCSGYLLTFVKWMEIPILILAGILVLIGLFVGRHMTRMKLIRVLLILFLLFGASSLGYHKLDEAGKIDQWLHTIPGFTLTRTQELKATIIAFEALRQPPI